MQALWALQSLQFLQGFINLFFFEGSFDFKKSHALDMLSYESIIFIIQDNQKLHDIQVASQTQLNHSFSRSKSKMTNNAHEISIQKEKQRAQTNGSHNGVPT